MFVYKVSELLDSLKSAHKDGFKYVSLSIVEADEETNYDSVCLDYIDSANSTEEDMIDSIVLPEGYSRY